MCRRLLQRGAGLRALLALAITAFFLNGCVYDVREIDLRGNEVSRASDNMAYLLVDKGDYSAAGQLVVRRIDGTDLNVVLDPCVYVLGSGEHTLSFSFYDSRKQGERVDHAVVVSLHPLIYHQLMPIRNRDEMRFDLIAIPEEKRRIIGRRELKSMVNYLMHGENQPTDHR